MAHETAHPARDVPNHDHYTLVYESRQEQFDSVAPFLEEGLEANDKCIYLFDETPREEIRAALRRRGTDVADALASGDLEIRPAEEVYLSGNGFDPDETVARLREAIRTALDSGYDRLRITGETTWMIEHDVDVASLREYEHVVDQLFPTDCLVGLCQYNRERFSPDVIDAVLETHPQIVGETGVQDNVYYSCFGEPPDGSNEATIDRKLETVSHHTRIKEQAQRRKQRLSALEESVQQFRGSEPTEIENAAVEVIAAEPDVILCSLWQYRQETGELEPQRTEHGLPAEEKEAVFERVEEAAWGAFAANERRELTVDAGASTEILAFPLSGRGVLLVASSETLTGTARDFLVAIHGQIETVLDSRAYEETLEEKDEQLTESKERLDRVEKINDVTREITRRVVDASTQEEIVEDVCRALIRECPFSFAWFGSYDEMTDDFDAIHATGDDRSYLDALSLAEGATGEPTKRAAVTQEPVVVENLSEDPPLSEWQEQAARRGYQSVIALPVRYDDSLYGVLSLYSDTRRAVADETLAVLEDLSKVIAHGINGVERKQALVADTFTEIEMRIADPDLPTVEFVDRADCRIEIDTVTAGEDGEFHVFATVHDVTSEALQSFGKRSPVIEHLELISEREGSFVCEWEITDHCLIRSFLDHNARPQSMRAENGEVHLVLHLPRGKRVREFVSTFQEKFSTVELVARRQRDRPRRHLSDIRAKLEAELTDRQLEILRIAHHSGYFERPRERTAEELADSIGVTHPTISRHLRESQRKIFDLLLD